MKAVLFFFLFLSSLLSTTWSLFAISTFYAFGGTHFMWLFALTFFSLAGSLLFGYAFAVHAKELK